MKPIKIALGTLVLGLLAACGGGGGGGPTVSGAVVKGPVLGSTVCAYALANGTKGGQIPLSGATGTFSAGCYVTGADGKYSFNLPGGTTGDILLEATGGKFCSNESEIAGGACASGGTVVDLGAGKMTAAVTAGANATVYTTPLTTAAVNNAGANLTAANFNAQFNTLAGAVIGAGTTVTPATPPTAANQPFLATAGQSLASGGTLSTVVSGLQSGGGSTGSDAPGTVNAALVATYSLVFQEGTKPCGSLCSYVPGQTYEFIVGSGNTLTIPGGKVLTNPVVRSYGGWQNPHEVIWLDAAAGVEYALSDNVDGQFNDLNVFDASLPSSNEGFIGQMKKPEPPATGVLANIAGSYALARQYAGASVAWSTITIAADGAVSFTGGSGPAITSAQVSTITSQINCCGRIDIMANFDLNGVSGDANDDKIMLYLDAENKLKDVEYYVGSSNSSTSKRGVTVQAPGQVLTTIGTPGEGNWTIPATNAVVGSVGGSPVSLPVSLFSGMGTGFTIMGESGNQRWRVSIASGSTITAGTNFSCIHNIATNDKEVSYQPNLSTTLTSKAGGNCNVYVTEIALDGGGSITTIKGRFTAEMFSNNKRSTTLVVADGAFAYVAP